MKTFRLILTFYKSFALASLLMTLACLGILYGAGKDGIHMLQAIFWFKVFTLGFIVYYINSYKRKEIYYYKNLGVSKNRLWIPILIFDFTLLLIFMIIIASRLNETHS